MLRGFSLNKAVIFKNLAHNLFSFCLFRAQPTAYGGSQTRGQIGATAASLRHSHVGSELCL